MAYYIEVNMQGIAAGHITTELNLNAQPEPVPSPRCRENNII